MSNSDYSNSNIVLKNNTSNSEHQWKEMLYTLFYEIKSEILGKKIEIEEDQYQENVKNITIPKLIDYIHDSIQILLKKIIDDTATNQKQIDEENFFNLYQNKNINKEVISVQEMKLYENLLKKLENKERILTKKEFQYQLQKEALENKIVEYIKMEDEFEEMKTKFKYEDGRFLKNDRKENEIIILRTENSNLKKNILKNEENMKKIENLLQEKEKIIVDLTQNLNDLKNKLEKKEKDIKILNTQKINNNNNYNNLQKAKNTKNKFIFNYNNDIVNNYNSFNYNYDNNSSKIDRNNFYKILPYQKIKPESDTNEISSRNDSKNDIFHKYFPYKKNMNNNCIKLNDFSTNHHNKSCSNIAQNYLLNSSNNHFTKIVGYNNYNNRSSTTKKKERVNQKIINCRNFSG